jgi:hypothetical protein
MVIAISLFFPFDVSYMRREVVSRLAPQEVGTINTTYLFAVQLPFGVIALASSRYCFAVCLCPVAGKVNPDSTWRYIHSITDSGMLDKLAEKFNAQQAVHTCK